MFFYHRYAHFIRKTGIHEILQELVSAFPLSNSLHVRLLAHALFHIPGRISDATVFRKEILHGLNSHASSDSPGHQLGAKSGSALELRRTVRAEPCGRKTLVAQEIFRFEPVQSQLYGFFRKALLQEFRRKTRPALLRTGEIVTGLALRRKSEPRLNHIGGLLFGKGKALPTGRWKARTYVVNVCNLQIAFADKKNRPVRGSQLKDFIRRSLFYFSQRQDIRDVNH